MRIGISELILVFVVALIVIGPDKLPRYAKKFGEALAAFRKASDEATAEIRKNVVEPLEEAQRPLREALEPVEELRGAVEENLKDVQSSLNRIGKPERKKPEKKGKAGNTAAEPEKPPEQAEPEKLSEQAEPGKPQEQTEVEKPPETVQEAAEAPPQAVQEGQPPQERPDKEEANA